MEDGGTRGDATEGLALQMLCDYVYLCVIYTQLTKNTSRA